MNVEIQVDDVAVMAALATVLRTIDPEVDQALLEAGEIVKQAAEAKIRGPFSRKTSEPNGQGRARKPLEERVTVKAWKRGVFVRARSAYAVIQEWGGTIGPHVILPRKRHALSIGNADFARVNHPGAKIAGKHFMRHAFLEKEMVVNMMVERAVRRAFERAGVTIL